MELNEKLARHFDTPPLPEWALTPYGKVKQSPYPDFTHSLDACFKWLVPRISHYLMHRTANGHYAECVGIRGETGSAEAETPAMAFCKACDQLIDAEGE